MSDPVKVIQADRDAVFEYLSADARYLFPSAVRSDFKDGKHDNNPIIQAFAKHRITTTEVMRKALEAIVAGEFNCSPHQRFMAAQEVAERALAALEGASE